MSLAFHPTKTDFVRGKVLEPLLDVQSIRLHQSVVPDLEFLQVESIPLRLLKKMEVNSTGPPFYGGKLHPKVISGNSSSRDPEFINLRFP